MGTRDPQVTIRPGTVRGTSDGAVDAFRGIPFAASPTGELRFRPPAVHPGWAGVLDCTRPGPAVPQGRSRLAAVMGEGETGWDEDGCLNLNVWTPADGVTEESTATGAETPNSADAGSGGGRPVLVWFHGGGFTSGSGGRAWYDGARLAAAGGIVVVTANYRLGPLGYIRLPGIGADNLGCQDQAAALRWVRDNIAAFGGDPGRVTVGGQSAGAFSALALAFDPATSHLVHRLLLQSGPWALSPQPPEDAAAVAERYLRILGVGGSDAGTRPGDDADVGTALRADIGTALRKVPAADLVSAYGELAAQSPRSGSLAPPMYPVLGGAGIPVAWQDALARGGLGGRRVLIGSTEHEITAFLAMSPSPAAHGHGEADASTPDASTPDAGTPGPGVEAATGEQFGAGVISIAEACAAGGASALVYRFTRVSAADPSLGATHCSDLPFAFDNLSAYADAAMLGPVSDGDRALAGSLSGALAGFAAGDPETDRAWAPYQPAADRHIRYFPETGDSGGTSINPPNARA
jgi:para-nitrobenzyl esterase